MRLRTLVGVGVISLFLFSAGCSYTSDPNPSLQESDLAIENKKGANKPEKDKKLDQLKWRLPKEFVYITKEEREELDRLKKQPIIYKGSNYSKKVALTFDDGPDVAITKQILNILKKERVPATFFVTGRMVKEYPQMLKQIAQDGHIIGNHTWSHPQLTKISDQKIVTELQRTNDIVEKEIGKKMLLFRPPYGATNSRVRKLAKEQGFLIINWSVDTNDWRGNSGPTIEEIVKKQISNGGIILQHNAGDKLQGTVDALPKIIKFLRDQNYQLVTVDQLLDSPPYRD